MRALPRPIVEALDAHTRRPIAYLQIDPGLMLTSAGGDLEIFGLGGLQLQELATHEAIFLEGLLPPTETPFVLPAIEVGGGRAADLHFYRDGNHVWVVLIDVTAERDQARRIQQKAYDMALLQEREALLNRKLEAANAALRETQRELESSRAALQQAHDRLQHELTEAAGYVRSLLPPPMNQPFSVDWRYVPSAALGGDAFGYGFIDPDHFALYLLDVCGHGIGPSLMSVAILHLLRDPSLGDLDFRKPGAVLAELNQRYQMKSNNDLYFTLWYGVYRPADRQLTYGCAGHPPALLVRHGEIQLLKAAGGPIGLRAGTTFAPEQVTVPEGSRLFLFSDGAFEVQRSDGSMIQLDDLLQFVSGHNSDLDRLYQQLVDARGSTGLEDDFAIVRFAF
jgi:serine phosphatase RsbU (regulator of sigma subunit)